MKAEFLGVRSPLRGNLMQLAALQSLARCVAQAGSTQTVLNELVRGIGMTEGVALTRVWMLEPSDTDESTLRLRASVGFSVARPALRWTRVDGPHSNLSLSVGKVGRIAATGEPLLLHRAEPGWSLDAKWVEEENIQSFAGQPLLFGQEVLGVVAVFSRRRLDNDDLNWLRVFADQGSAAAGLARARSELKRLRRRLTEGLDPDNSSVEAISTLGSASGELLERPDEVISEGQWRELERKNIVKALRLSDGKVAGPNGAAARLGLKPSTLTYRMQSLGIVRGQRRRANGRRSERREGT